MPDALRRKSDETTGRMQNSQVDHAGAICSIVRTDRTLLIMTARSKAKSNDRREALKMTELRTLGMWLLVAGAVVAAEAAKKSDGGEISLIDGMTLQGWLSGAEAS